MIEVEKNNATWTVTLNRPDKANALTLEMLAQLEETFAQAHQAPGLKALVLTGAGDRVFSAGADLSQVGDTIKVPTSPLWEAVSNRLARLPVFTIAALNGTLAGGSFGMALACDLRISVPGAKFFYPVLKNGFLPQPSDAKRMIALVGPARAKLILLAGQKLTAQEAFTFGLIDRIVPLEDMPDAITALTTDALNAPAHISTATKRMLDPSLSDQTLQDCLRAVYDDDDGAKNRLR